MSWRDYRAHIERLKRVMKGAFAEVTEDDRRQLFRLIDWSRYAAAPQTMLPLASAAMDYWRAKSVDHAFDRADFEAFTSVWISYSEHFRDKLAQLDALATKMIESGVVVPGGPPDFVLKQKLEVNTKAVPDEQSDMAAARVTSKQAPWTISAGLAKFVGFGATLTARLQVAAIGDDDDEAGGEDEVVEAGIVQAVRAVRRVLTFSDGTTVEVVATVSTPVRDGDGEDLEFAQKPDFDRPACVKLGGFSVQADVHVPDAPQSTLHHALSHYTKKQSDAAVLTGYVQQDQFRTGIMARWEGQRRIWYDWIEWETDIEISVEAAAKGPPTVEVEKGDIRVTKRGTGEADFGPPGQFINDHVTEVVNRPKKKS